MNNLYDYENQISKEKKKNLGITYTPKRIINYINDKCLSLWKEDYPPKVVDFSCGTGVFLVDMANKISERYSIDLKEVYSNYIFANDIDKEAVQIFQEATGCTNCTVQNGLDHDLSDYDIIVGNPPYVRIQNLDKDTQDKLKTFDWCKKGNSDLYIAMTQMMADSKKIFGLICPNSWMKTKTGSAMRSWFLNGNCETLIDFRGEMLFKESTYSSILIVSSSTTDRYTFKTSLEDVGEQKKFSQIKENNFFLKDAEIKCLEQNEKKSLVFLDHFDVKVGLATLFDKGYYLEDCKIKGDYVVGKGIKVEKKITRRCYKASKLSTYNNNREDYFIYPYDSNKKVLSDEHVSKTFPLAYQHLLKSKSSFLNRDKGSFGELYKEGKVEWFEYGRSQGLSLKEEKILLSPIVSKVFHKKIDSGLFFSGYCIYPIGDQSFEVLQKILKSEDFMTWVKINGSPKRGGYISLNKSTFQGFKFDK